MQIQYRVESRKGCFPCDDLDQAKQLADKHGGSIWQFLNGQWRPWPLADAAATPAKEPETVQVIPHRAQPDESKAWNGRPRCEFIKPNGDRCGKDVAIHEKFCGLHRWKESSSIESPPETKPEDAGSSYADRYPGMKNERYIGIPDKICTTAVGSSVFIPVVADETPKQLQNRLSSSLRVWKPTAQLKCSILQRDGGVIVKVLGRRESVTLTETVESEQARAEELDSLEAKFLEEALRYHCWDEGILDDDECTELAERTLPNMAARILRLRRANRFAQRILKNEAEAENLELAAVIAKHLVAFYDAEIELGRQVK